MSTELSDAEKYIAWMHTKANLNARAASSAKRFVKRGQVYWCHFGLNIGSEMSKSTPRPAIVVSSFTINKSSPNVIVIPVTHNQSKLSCLVQITPIKNQDGCVILDGQANTADVICVSKARLGDLITTLSATQMEAIDKSIALSLDLFHYYSNSIDKYDKLSHYTEQIKADRNKAQGSFNQLQDIINQLTEIVTNSNFDEECQIKIKDLLDI